MLRMLQCSLWAILFLYIVSPNISFSQAAANDECAGATVIPATLPQSINQNTRAPFATPNASDPFLNCADGGGGNTVWFTFTPDSSGWVKFTTVASTPTTYDIAMALYTGSCGSLNEVACDDDVTQGTVRQSEIVFEVTSGVSYIIHVAEWNGGGPNGGVPTGGDLVLQLSWTTEPPYIPLVQGPKSGSIAGGDSMVASSLPLIAGRHEQREREVENEEAVPLLPLPPKAPKPLAPEGSNYFEDLGVGVNGPTPTNVSIPNVVKDFQGQTYDGVFPPDPMLAVGPNEVIAMDNLDIDIWDKDGNKLLHTDGDAWFDNVMPPGKFYSGDPQILYDHFENRWVLLGFTGSTPNELFLSVSATSDAMGTWYNWFMPTGLGDSVTGNFADHPQMGYDDSAIYVMTREFGTVDRYSRLRIIGKAQLYNNTAGPVTWTDFWDFRDPLYKDIAPDNIKPSFQYGTPGVHFFVNVSPFTVGTYFTVWTLSDRLTNPTFTAENVPVVQYRAEPLAEQIGGGTAIESGGTVLRHKVIYKDSCLYMVHGIASGTNNKYSAIHYVRINPFTHTTLEDYAMGKEGFWHFYSALMVDSSNNIVITYSRSGENDHIGAFLSGRRKNDPPGLSPSVELKRGVATYSLVGSGRNRWGDYMGIGLDPTDPSYVWVNTEFVSATNVWETQIGKVTMEPVAGAIMHADPPLMTYSTIELGNAGDIHTFDVANSGTDTLVLTFQFPDSHYTVLNPPVQPLKLAANETASFDVQFTPEIAGTFNDTIVILSNDSNHPQSKVALSGVGFEVYAAESATMYAGAGSILNGQVYTVNQTTGSSSSIGYSGYSQVLSMRMHPVSHLLIGLSPSGSSHRLSRINSHTGDAHELVTIDIPTLKGMAFTDNGDSLYLARVNGLLYKASFTTGGYRQIGNTGLIVGGLAIHPVTGELWASIRPSSGVLDRIYKINKNTGAATIVGTTGFGQATQDIIFDDNGNLYGLIGSSSQINRLILIDTLTGAGTLVGSLGYSNIQALAIGPGTFTNTATLSLKPDWNMVSVPLAVSNYDVNTLFPSPVSSAFAYSGNYDAKTTLNNSEGYWLKFASSKTHIMFGDEIDADTVNVRKGWNILGSLSHTISAGGVQPISPVTTLSGFAWYDPDSGYVFSNSIVPGRAYWIKADTSGQVALVDMLTAKQTSFDQGATLREMNSLKITDANGRSQVLYFGSGMTPEVQSRFELPPPPPTGTFFGRFSSNSIVEVHSQSLTADEEFPISIESARYPLTLTWHTKKNNNTRYIIISENRETKNTTSHSMNSEGSLVMSDEQAVLRLHVEQNILPTEFALTQNYPNPFNPGTVINFQLPVASNVSLKVFNVLGQEVTTLANSTYEAGTYDITFNAGNLASGIYFYKLSAEPVSQASGKGAFNAIQKMMLLK